VTLEKLQIPHSIVTSGSRPLFEGWSKVLNLLQPANVIVAEDVQHGKPDPEGYMKGKSLLRLQKTPVQGSTELQNERSFLVIEDAPAGVRAGKAADCKVLAVVTTHTVEQLKAAGADWVVPDLRSLEIREGQDQAQWTVILKNIIS
jgi:glycerol 3-phosphatase-1